MPLDRDCESAVTWSPGEPKSVRAFGCLPTKAVRRTLKPKANSMLIRTVTERLRDFAALHLQGVSSGINSDLTVAGSSVPFRTRRALFRRGQ